MTFMAAIGLVAGLTVQSCTGRRYRINVGDTLCHRFSLHFAVVFEKIWMPRVQPSGGHTWFEPKPGAKFLAKIFRDFCLLNEIHKR